MPRINYRGNKMLGFSIPSVKIHKGAILMKLLNGEYISNKELFHDFDTCASAARICELRSDGWLIDDIFVYQRTTEGKHVRIKKYFIKRDNIMEYLQNEDVCGFLERARLKYNC